MPKKAAQGVNVHAAHKTAFGKVVPQAMGRDIFAQSRSAYVALEVCLIGVNIDMSAGVLDREEVITLNVSVLVLQPSSQNTFCSLRKIDDSVLPAFGDFCSEHDLSSGKVDVFQKQAGTLTQTHSAVNHQHGHYKIPVLRKVRLVKEGNELFEIFITDVLFWFSVDFELLDFLHGVLFDDVTPVEPIEEGTQIADIIVDGDGGNSLSVITSACRII